MFFTFPWELHGSVTEWEPGHRWSFLVLRLRHPRKGGRLAWPAGLGMGRAELEELSTLLLGATRRSWPAGDELPWLMPRLVAALSAKAPAPVIESYLVLVLTALKVVLKEGERSLQAGEDRRILALQQRIRERPLDRWSLSEMERVSGLARSRLDELFRRQAGDSPVAFARRVRIEWAGRCLLGRPASVTEIAHECGFCSSQHFARVFRLIHGCTPTEFRKRGAGRGRRGSA